MSIIGMCMLSLLALCECDEQRSVEDEFTIAQAVFIGVVEDVKVPHWDPNSAAAPRSTSYVFRLRRSYKNIRTETATVSIQPLSDCAFDFIVGKEYLVYAYAHALSSNVLYTTQCSRTVLYSEADDDLAQLPEPIKTWER